MITGTSLSRRISRHTEKPSRSGSIRSSSTTSGRLPRAVRPDPAPRGRLGDLVPLVLQGQPQRPPHPGIVLDQQHAACHAHQYRSARRTTDRWRSRLVMTIRHSRHLVTAGRMTTLVTVLAVDPAAARAHGGPRDAPSLRCRYSGPRRRSAHVKRRLRRASPVSPPLG